MFSFDDNRKIGIGLTILGVAFTFLGILLFFDRAFLALGDLAFLTGLCFILGLQKTARFFFKKEKAVGSAFFFFGFVLVLYGWPLIGFLIQIYGVWKLFSAFLPNVVQAVKMSPIGWIFNLPGFKQVGDWIYDQRRLPL
uniref:Vesicle transport protein n=1 Tax=Chromera velia CCMP2878 TaxID=1169474 RepID=A0A0G4I9K1_9ALVE|eukprot:Cvel_12269.t1-p1 / transcript=Cvel_12269.t1 / gene=Cvel_12269 / organism=Chromera_velia_CCMP2878 / gene_product=Vesicle transport protein GOT1B, putative / transcript_product=Vesicle transport protein GOT1B, putative / location=Cvel_scaffold795:27136-29099(+) / protein_length=138 / sequence_SO=supercontig / SO=protein_coding / is_pseudo=false